MSKRVVSKFRGIFPSYSRMMVLSKNATLGLSSPLAASNKSFRYFLNANANSVDSKLLASASSSIEYDFATLKIADNVTLIFSIMQLIFLSFFTFLSNNQESYTP